MLGVQLMSVNAYLHTSIMYGQWKDWDGDTGDEPPLFYRGLTESAATLLSSSAEEIVKIANAVEIKTKEEISKVRRVYLLTAYPRRCSNHTFLLVIEVTLSIKRP